MTFLDELKRRNVLRAGAAYLVVAWLLVQVAATIFPAFGMGGVAVRIVVTLLAIGFIPALVFAWVFEITPEGLKRGKDVDYSQSVTSQTGKRLDRIIMVVLALALGYFAIDKFVLLPQREANQVRAARKEGRTEALVESYGDKSIAVLPFVDMSPGKDQEYFSDGISEELLNLLAKVPELRVISRSSAFSYKGKDIKLVQVAEELNVAHILEGSVRQSGNRVRVTAQLIEAPSDTHLWSQTWDRTLDDIFAVQDEIAAAVVGQLKITLLGAAPTVQQTDPKAYALYLQARQLNRQATAESREHSIALYQQALAIDPGYAAAWVGLARNYINQVGSGHRPIEEGYRLARETVTKALAVDPDFAPAYALLGRIAMDYDDDLPAAARYFEHALALEPGNTDVIGSAATLAGSLGRFDSAIALCEHQVARDPVNASGFYNLGFTYLSARRLDEAIATLGTSLSLSPGRNNAQSLIAVALLLKGEAEAALKATQQETSEAWRLIGLPMAYHALGRTTESDAALAALIQRNEKEMAYNIAYVLAFRGEADRAFEWLDKAVAYSDPGLAEIAAEPLFENIQGDPRWLPFLRRIGRAPEQLAAIRFDVKLPAQ